MRQGRTLSLSVYPEVSTYSTPGVVNNLSDEVRKGQLGKLEEGGYPGGYPPFGYKKVKTELVPEEPYASFVTRLYEIFDRERPTLKEITKKANKLGFRTRKGRRLTKSIVHRFLTNPIYCGVIEWRGKLYPGKHRPLVDKPTFKRVGAWLSRKSSNHWYRHDFTYRGLMRCGDCGCAITAEVQKGFVYYHCSFYYPCSQHSYTREEDIEGQVLDVLKRLHLGQKATEAVKQKIIADRAEDDNLREMQLTSLQKQFDAMNDWIDKLYDDRMAGIIDEEMYKRKYQEYVTRRDETKDSLENYMNFSFDTFELSTNLVDLADRASEIYQKRQPEEKRLLLNLLLSNALLKDKKLGYSLKNPFNWVVEYKKSENWSALLKKVRTYFKSKR